MAKKTATKTATKKAKRPIGRPPLTIDFKKVVRLLKAGCSGNEIAGQLGVHPDTLYKAAEREHPDFDSWSDFAAHHRAAGDALLKARQFERAVAGNVPMLKFLGINRLGQSMRVEHTGNVTQTFRVVDDVADTTSSADGS